MRTEVDRSRPVVFNINETQMQFAVEIITALHWDGQTHIIRIYLKEVILQVAERFTGGIKLRPTRKKTIKW